jgi:hypothetical protein
MLEEGRVTHRDESYIFLASNVPLDKPITRIGDGVYERVGNIAMGKRGWMCERKE